MGRQIFECEQDYDSVIIWESGFGTRIRYWSEKQAEGVAAYLIEKANQFHQAKSSDEDNIMTTLTFYSGEFPDGYTKTEYQFIREFIDTAKRNGFVTQDGLTRPEKEYW